MSENDDIQDPFRHAMAEVGACAPPLGHGHCKVWSWGVDRRSYLPGMRETEDGGPEPSEREEVLVGPSPALSDEAILEVMRRVATERGGAPTVREWKRLRPLLLQGGGARPLTASFIRARFGRWPEPWATAGVEATGRSRGTCSRAALGGAPERLACRLGQAPTALAMQRDPATPLRPVPSQGPPNRSCHQCRKANPATLDPPAAPLRGTQRWSR